MTRPPTIVLLAVCACLYGICFAAAQRLVDAGHTITLASHIALLQTPSAADAMGGHLSRGGARSGELLLKGQVKALLPTPTGDDADNVTRESGEFQSLARTAHNLLPTPMANPDNPGAGGGRTTDTTGKLLPTPTNSGRGNRDQKESRHFRHGPTLNDAAEEMWSGAPTNPPSDGGSTSPDNQPQIQLTIEGA